MASNLKLSDTAVNAKADAFSDLLDSGYLRIFDGTQPANAGVAVSTQTLLAELRFNATASAAASAGVLTMNAFTQDASANATGTATWFRALKSDGTTIVYDGNVGTSGSDLNLNSTSVTSGVAVSVTSMTWTEGKSA
jgi:hypothetical protein